MKLPKMWVRIPKLVEGGAEGVPAIIGLVLIVLAMIWVFAP